MDGEFTSCGYLDDIVRHACSLKDSFVIATEHFIYRLDIVDKTIHAIVIAEYNEADLFTYDEESFIIKTRGELVRSNANGEIVEIFVHDNYNGIVHYNDRVIGMKAYYVHGLIMHASELVDIRTKDIICVLPYDRTRRNCFATVLHWVNNQGHYILSKSKDIRHTAYSLYQYYTYDINNNEILIESWGNAIFSLESDLILNFGQDNNHIYGCIYDCDIKWSDFTINHEIIVPNLFPLATNRSKILFYDRRKTLMIWSINSLSKPDDS